jgi:hypothetical protein
MSTNYGGKSKRSYFDPPDAKMLHLNIGADLQFAYSGWPMRNGYQPSPKGHFRTIDALLIAPARGIAVMS